MAGTLPPGLTLFSSTGRISGTPFATGTYVFFVTVQDSTGTSAAQDLSIDVIGRPLEFSGGGLPVATEGVDYLAVLSVTGGLPPYSFHIVSGQLPTGLDLNPNTGVISGVPVRGTAGSRAITLGVTDGSSFAIVNQQTFTLLVRRGFWDGTVAVSASLAGAQTGVYVDGTRIAVVQGGQSTSFSAPVGRSVTVSVDALVPDAARPDIRYKVDVERVTASEQNPNVSFNYTPQYLIDVRVEPASLSTPAGSDFYSQGTALRTSARSQVEGGLGTQYRFSHWLLPTGETIKGVDLRWTVTMAGRVVATYDTYYLLTVNSEKGNVIGAGFVKAGTAAGWSISPPEASLDGILGFFRGKYVPDRQSGTEIMDGPKTVRVNWQPDYTLPIILIPLSVILLGALIFGLYLLFRSPALAPAAPAQAPAMAAQTAPQLPAVQPQPTFVVIRREQIPAAMTLGTRESFLEEFKLLLEKYESEVAARAKAQALPEARKAAPEQPAVAAASVPEAQRLAAPQAPAPTCNYSARNLVRTVVGKWRKEEEKAVAPRTEQAAETGLSIATVWARDIYNEFEVFTCSLPAGHTGRHEGATSLAYTLQNTVKEERVYSGREKPAPPKPHFTDDLPEADVSSHQLVSGQPGEAA